MRRLSCICFLLSEIAKRADVEARLAAAQLEASSRASTITQLREEIAALKKDVQDKSNLVSSRARTRL